MLMICESAGKCNLACNHKKTHDSHSFIGCSDGCTRSAPFQGSMCIPYVPASEPLTDHAKYCRLSKQPGGLCGRFAKTNHDDWCTNDDINDVLQNVLRADWTQCPRPEKQESVELPKDSLEELCRKYSLRLLAAAPLNSLGKGCAMFREFAEKVRALK